MKKNRGVITNSVLLVAFTVLSAVMILCSSCSTYPKMYNVRMGNEKYEGKIYDVHYTYKGERCKESMVLYIYVPNDTVSVAEIVDPTVIRLCGHYDYVGVGSSVWTYKLPRTNFQDTFSWAVIDGYTYPIIEQVGRTHF